MNCAPLVVAVAPLNPFINIFDELGGVISPQDSWLWTCYSSCPPLSHRNPYQSVLYMGILSRWSWLRMAAMGRGSCRQLH